MRAGSQPLLHPGFASGSQVSAGASFRYLLLVPEPGGSAARDFNPTNPDASPGYVLTRCPRACYVEQGHPFNRGQKAPLLGHLRALHVQLTFMTLAALAAGIIHD